MNIKEYSKILSNVPNERSIASEVLKITIKKISNDELSVLINDIPSYRKNIYTIIYDEYIERLKRCDKHEREEIDKRFIERMDIEKLYLRKIRLANYFDKLLENEISYSDQITSHLMNNCYYSIRRIGYGNANVNLNNTFIEKLIENNQKYNDDILGFLLSYKLSEKTINILTEYLEEYYSDEYKDYIPFEDMKARNNILIKLEKSEMKKIEQMKKDDSLSYIYIMKSLKRNIDSDYLYNVFYSFDPRKLYLIRWYDELGNL